MGLLKIWSNVEFRNPGPLDKLWGRAITITKHNGGKNMKKFIALYRLFNNPQFITLPDDAVLPIQKEEIYANSLEEAKERALSMQINAPSGGRVLMTVSEFKEPSH